MRKLLQKDAVFEAVMKVLDDCGVNFAVEQDALNEVLDKELRIQVVNHLFNDFRQGRIFLAKIYTDKELRVYCGGLISNWMKKDIRLNGGIAHTIKRPGSRIGCTTDPMIKELRKMLQITKGTATEAQVKKEISNRQEDLRKEQAKSIQIDINAIPENLRHLVTNRKE